MLPQLASIQSALPQLQQEAAALGAQVAQLKQGNVSAVRRADEVRARIAQHKDGVMQERQSAEQLKKQAAQTRAEADELLKEASDVLFSLTGRRYAISH